MPRQSRSARGEIVNFDLLQIKDQMAAAPKPVEVKAREDFIEKKLRRRVKRIVRPPVEPVAVTEAETEEPEQ